MSTELSNGVIIPEEYSDDWYDEMSINLRKLNDVITAASDNATDIQRLDTDKANQSDLTALTSRVSQNETDIIALQTAVSGALKREIVQSLPTEDISTTTIYMIRNSQSSGTNIYDEYMYINSQWELIGTSATDFSNYYTKNETDNLLSGKVDNSTLGSYYTKTESDNLLSAKANQTDLTALSGRVTQNETDITALQTAVSGALKREIVQTLPTQDISTTTIYMIRNTTTSGDNIYDEYMYINNLWELIGTSATDFSNYYTKTEIDTLLSDKANNSDVVHTSGNETISGDKVFNTRLIKNIDVVLGTAPSTGKFSNIDIADNNKASLLQILGGVYDTGNSYARFFIQNKTADDGTGLSPTGTLRTCGFNINLPATSTSEGQGSIIPRANKATDFGLLSYQWRNVWCEKLFLNGTQLDPSAFALDNAVVHLSGDETVGGKKTFSENITCSSNSDAKSIIVKTPLSTYDSTNTVGDNTKIRFLDKNNNSISYIMQRKLTNGSTDLSLNVSNTDSNNQPIEATLTFILDSANEPRLSPGIDNTISIGRPTFRYKSFYGMNYYYGSNNVEFSTKFVTTDTNQTISGNKTFSSNVNVYNSDSATDTANIILKNSKAERGSTTNIGEQTIFFLDKDNAQISQIKSEVDDNGVSTLTLNCTNSSNSSSGIRLRRTSTGTVLQPTYNNGCNLGTSGYRWYNVQTRAVNNLEPSSLSLPSDRSARIDISSYFTNTGSGNTNDYSVPANGFIFLNLLNAFAVICYSLDESNTTNYAQSYFRQVDGQIYILFPVRKNDVFRTLWTSNGGTITVTGAHFIPCQGNV